MVDDQIFEVYRQQIMLMTHMIAARRRSEAVEDRASSLEAACKCASLSLERDLAAIGALEKTFESLGSAEIMGLAPPRSDSASPLSAA